MAIREVASSATGRSFSVNGDSLGTADATYSTIALAEAASSDGDTIVLSEDKDYGDDKIGVVAYTLDIVADDEVRHDGTFDTGARISITSGGGFISCRPQSGDTLRLVNLDIKTTITSSSQKTIELAGNNGTTIISGCLVTVDGDGSYNGYAILMLNSTALRTVRIEWCVLFTKNRAKHCFTNTTADVADSDCEIRNTIAFIDDSTVGGSATLFNTNGADTTKCGNCLALEGPNAGLTVIGYDANVDAVSRVAYNGANDGSAPGNITYDNLIASNLIYGYTEADFDPHWIDRATMEGYPGEDFTGQTQYEVDIDGDSVDSWYIGPDFVPEVADDTKPIYLTQSHPFYRRRV